MERNPGWVRFENEEVREKLGPLLKERGVYAFRWDRGPKTFPRYVPLYIGRTEKSFRERFGGYFHPGPTQPTNQKIREFGDYHRIEVRCFPTKDPVGEERKRIRDFENAIGMLPPLNRNRPSGRSRRSR